MLEGNALIRKNMSRKPNIMTSQGFTLIEIVVVMAIIAALAALVVGAISIARRTAIETVHRSNARTIKAGIEAYYGRYKSYPPTTVGMPGNSISFATIADNGAGHLNVQLSSTPECHDPGGWGNGGGQVWISADSTQYDIVPYDASCFNEDRGSNLTQ